MESEVVSVGIFDAAHHARPSPPATARRLSTHPIPLIVQMKKFLICAPDRLIPPPGASPFILPGIFCIGAAYTVIVRQTSGYALGSVKEESDARGV